MMKNLFLAAATVLVASSAMAETVTFDYTTSDPYEWESLQKDGSGYIATPLTCRESPVEVLLDGKFRRMAQQAFGGIECLLMYQNATANVSVSEGYKITSVTFFTGNAKCEQLACVSEGTGLSPQELTDATYTHASSGAELKQATRTAICGVPAQSVEFKVTTKGTQVITKIEVEYTNARTDYNYYNFTAFEGETLDAFPEIKVGTWWTTNPEDEGTYTGGTEFRPLTISLGVTNITFSYDGEGGHGNVRGTTTSKQNNLQLGGGSCFSLSTDTEKYRLRKVEVQGNRKRTATGLSLVDQMKTNDDGIISVDTETQILTWTPAEGTNAACYLDATSNGAYIESITAHYEGIGTGVANITDENNGIVEYFNLQGIRCENLAPGIYIRRQGCKSEKIVLR